MAIVAEIISSPQFDCYFCKEPKDVNYDEKIKAELDDIIDFVEHSYKPKI